MKLPRVEATPQFHFCHQIVCDKCVMSFDAHGSKVALEPDIDKVKEIVAAVWNTRHAPNR